jgi:hypothetical protein
VLLTEETVGGNAVHARADMPDRQSRVTLKIYVERQRYDRVQRGTSTGSCRDVII